GHCRYLPEISSAPWQSASAAPRPWNRAQGPRPSQPFDPPPLTAPGACVTAVGRAISFMQHPPRTIMLKTVLLTLLSLVMAIGGGAASVWFVLEETPLIGAIEAGPWTAYPSMGTPEAGPYSQARFAREGGIPLGRSEGIAFT